MTTTPPLRIPLFAKIAVGLLANLLLVGALIGGFVAAQYHLGLDSLLAGRAGDRMEAVSRVIAGDLDDAAPARWDTILHRFGESYGVRFALYRGNAPALAGDHFDLPRSIQERLADRRPNGPPGGHPPDASFADGGSPALRDVAPPRRGPRPLRPGPTMLHTSQPSLYWVLTRLPIGPPGPPPAGSPPYTLVAVSASLAGGGLFFDWTPWLAVAGGVLTVSVLCWLPLVRGLTRATRRLTEATGRIAEGRFDVRVPDENRRDELGALAGSINRMAARLDGFVSGQKRFLGDTAHELCAPLARLQLATGILEQRADPTTAGHVADLREELEQMAALVDELLSFSRASLAGSSVARQPVELLPIVRRVAHREAPDDPTCFDVQIPAGLYALGDPDLLFRSLANLLRNGVRHAPAAGPVVVFAEHGPGDVRLHIRDRGPGVPPDALARLFDPFYRVDLSRDRATGGIGLGLAIVKTCVEACGGTVSCRNLAPTGFEVTLVLAAAGAPEVTRVPSHDVR